MKNLNKPQKPYRMSDIPPDDCLHKVYKMYSSRKGISDVIYFVDMSVEGLISFGKDFFNKTPHVAEEFHKITSIPTPTQFDLIKFIEKEGDLYLNSYLCKDHLTRLVEYFKDAYDYELVGLNEEFSTFQTINVSYKKSKKQYEKEMTEWENREEIYKNKLEIYQKQMLEYKKIDKLQYKKRLEEKLKLLNEELG